MSTTYLLDTHALVFWQNGSEIPISLKTLLDHEAVKGNVVVSSASFWEIALLVKKGKINLPDVGLWKDTILRYSGIKLINPGVDDMIASVALPNHHRDPFDRLLLAQAAGLKAVLVTRDSVFSSYGMPVLWCH